MAGILPFVLHPIPIEDAHLCPVRALCEWLHASRISSGYVFRKMTSGDRPSAEETSPMASCQYLSVGKRWPLHRICAWGGWSTDFTNLTIVKYLISWNDDDLEDCEDYFNPSLVPAVKCFKCGRTCKCR
ncbi:hypothetical protein BDN70DRAFT_909371 [Pholiota conissans]|uniref:Uncharacterized protein n=1 Tax=Pholiota conissans TaxID=109636 RepID=A0A9P5YM00_9AGAR|nr:hypothetical protein BDN70DRAFT_909371 [Pholiota conissans]